MFQFLIHNYPVLHISRIFTNFTLISWILKLIAKNALFLWKQPFAGQETINLFL